VSFNSNLRGASSGAATANHSGTLGFTLAFIGVRVTQSLVICVVFRTSLFVHLSFFFSLVYCPSLSICGFWLPLWYLQTIFVRISEANPQFEERIDYPSPFFPLKISEVQKFK